MSSPEDREYEWRQEQAQARDNERLRRLGPEYAPDEPEPDEEERDELELDAWYDDVVESLRFRVVCDGPELDEPVVVERRL